MNIIVHRKNGGQPVDLAPHLANDAAFLEKHGLIRLDNEVKKPPIQQVVESKIETEKQVEVETKEPVKKGRKPKK